MPLADLLRSGALPLLDMEDQGQAPRQRSAPMPRQRPDRPQQGQNQAYGLGTGREGSRRVKQRPPQQSSGGGVMAPQGSPVMDIFGGGQQGGGFGDVLSRLGPALMMASGNPNYIQTGAALQQQQGEARQSRQAKNQTMSWLTDQGVGEREAAYLAGDPEAMRAWYNEWRSGGKPDWKIGKVNTEDGEVDAMIDRNTGRWNPLEGAAPQSDDPAPTNLSKLLRERNALREENPDDPNLQVYDARIQREAQGSGVALEVGPDGEMRFVQGPGAAGEMGALSTKSRRDMARQDVAEMDIMLDRVDNIIGAIEEDPTRGGVMGNLRRTLQRGVGVAQDIGEMTGVSDFVEDMRGSARQVASERGVDENLARDLEGDFFDPELTQIEVFQNSLAIALAKARQGGGRLLRDTYRDAKADTEIAELRSSREVQERLKTIRAEIEAAKQGRQRLLSGERQGESSQSPQRRRYNPETGQLE